VAIKITLVTNIFNFLKDIEMKKLSFKNVSLVGLVLLGVSAITTAMIPSKPAVTGEPGNGKVIDSTDGGGRTVIQTDAGPRSYTATNAANVFDGFSATGVGSATNGPTGNATASSTTATLAE
jgi:hypothetical protein